MQKNVCPTSIHDRADLSNDTGGKLPPYMQILRGAPAIPSWMWLLERHQLQAQQQPLLSSTKLHEGLRQANGNDIAAALPDPQSQHQQQQYYEDEHYRRLLNTMAPQVYPCMAQEPFTPIQEAMAMMMMMASPSPPIPSSNTVNLVTTGKRKRTPTPSSLPAQPLVLADPSVLLSFLPRRQGSDDIFVHNDTPATALTPAATDQSSSVHQVMLKRGEEERSNQKLPSKEIKFKYHMSISPQCMSSSGSSQELCTPPVKKRRTGVRQQRQQQQQQQGDGKTASSASAGARNGRVCSHCGARKSCEWRSGPEGPATLCNACGLRYRKRMKADELRQAKGGTGERRIPLSMLLNNTCKKDAADKYSQFTIHSAPLNYANECLRKASVVVVPPTAAGARQPRPPPPNLPSFLLQVFLLCKYKL